ncbi:hypothetical protein KUTeg_001488 [Tegillarca granosa]|uniref:Phosphatidylinositol 3-kinase n=1 Tax=Tegillarca granosa TaxID=220873 RepID=A0ABQ9FUS9_TEGGR|nr:hypothetical protein KUTeg_001488 [Tegillarca granosa]
MTSTHDDCDPMGTVSINPLGDNASSLMFVVSDFNHKHGHILYPGIEKIKVNFCNFGAVAVLQCASDNMEEPGVAGSPNWRPSKTHLQQLEKILEEDVMTSYQLAEQDKELCWLLRYECRDHFPHALPLVLTSVKWDNHIDVAKMQALLQTWSKLPVDQALELLDFNFPDHHVRKYATDCLAQLSRDHLAVLSKQQEALTKLEALSTIAKASTQRTNKPKRVVEELKHLLNQKSYTECLTDLYSPLTPLYKLDVVLIDKFKVMDSKKKPLWIRWKNADEEGQDIPIIYKNGDDLRQDMLTLQILQIMDNIWLAEGYDLRLNAYGCIATGREEGMIEVVKDSNTIAGIQKSKNVGAFAKESLFEWLKDKNPSEESLNRAVEEFTYSCCGYAVATYILGIGDRHNDNIMLKETGQLFHIDFGHFLGNFKSKLKIKRERVPFILTDHFKYVITKGGTNSENFIRFQDLCENAYLVIRKKGQLLMRLFMMMLQSGIPQLMSVNDVDYLKDTLALTLNEHEAHMKFRQNFKLAVSKNWTTNFNWAIHNLVH